MQELLKLFGYDQGQDWSFGYNALEDFCRDLSSATTFDVSVLACVPVFFNKTVSNVLIVDLWKKT